MISLISLTDWHFSPTIAPTSRWGMFARRNEGERASTSRCRPASYIVQAQFKEKYPMEGSNTRTFPRMLLDKPVEVQIGGDTIRVENPTNNLSVGGLFLHRSGLPVGAAVRVRISSPRPFEAEGRIFNCGNGEAGAGIGFDSLSGRSREALDDLIEDLTLRGLPAA
jgi:PilZ domain